MIQLALEIRNGLVLTVLRLWLQGQKFKLIFWSIREKSLLPVNSVNMFATVKTVSIGTTKHYIKIFFLSKILCSENTSNFVSLLSISVSCCLLQMDLLDLNNRKWACPFCPKVFRKPSELKRHEMIHTGEKPFVCTMCDYASNRKANLQSHVLRHHSSVETKYNINWWGA